MEGEGVDLFLAGKRVQLEEAGSVFAEI